jgi:FMN phosphatase YigB (HAD superfamily)
MLQFSTKAIIADMDGVLFKHTALSKQVASRAISFVKKRINPYMSDRKARQINEVLYKNYGHTLIGLKELYDPTATIKDYCDYVYDNDFINQMNTIPKDDIFYENAIEVKRFINRIRMQHIHFYIFSNASVEWCMTCMKMMDIDVDTFQVIGCNSEVHGKGMSLKPYKESYVNLFNHVHDISGFEYKTQMIYIDDQMINLQPIINNPYWKTVWYDSKKEKVYSDRLYCIQELSQLLLLV